MKYLLSLFDLFSHKEKRNLFVIIPLVIGLAFFEAAGIASVIPFLGVLGDPEIIQKNSRLKVFYEYSQMYGISSTANFLILLGVLSFTFIVISALYRSLTQYFLARFVETFRHNLSVRLVKKFWVNLMKSLTAIRGQ